MSPPHWWQVALWEIVFSILSYQSEQIILGQLRVGLRECVLILIKALVILWVLKRLRQQLLLGSLIWSASDI